MQKLLKNKKGFTLLELMIVIGIIGILSVILFRTFGTVSELAFRIEQEKNVTQEIISFSQILQNYADKNTIDYEKYTTLTETNGLSDVLYLSGQDWGISFYSSGDCIQPGEIILSGIQELQCALYLQKDWESPIEITNPKKTYLSKVVFKIIPFASQEQYLAMTWTDENTNLIYSLNKPGFWFFTKVRNARYAPGTRWNNVEIPVQQFFSLK